MKPDRNRMNPYAHWHKISIKSIEQISDNNILREGDLSTFFGGGFGGVFVIS